MMRPRDLMRLVVRAAKAWSDDYAPSMGAAISYYTVFSLAPLLVIVIAIAGAVFGREAVQGQLVAQMGGLVGEQGASLVQSLVAASSDTHKGLIAGVASIVALLLGATSVFTELQNALDRIWHVPASRKPKGVWGILRSRLLSFGMILGLVFLLMVSLAVSAAVAAFGSFTSGLMPGAEVLLQLLNIAISLGISTLLFAMIYKLLPNTPIAWRDVWVGALATGLLFEAGKFLIGLYLGKSSITQTFAAAGSLVVLIAWVYYAAQIFLLGAEFTKVYAQAHGSQAAQQAVEMTAATAALGTPAEGPASGAAGPLTAAAAVAATPGAAPPRHPHRHGHGHAQAHASAHPSAVPDPVVRVLESREKILQAEPAAPLPRSQSALAGVSAVVGMVAVAVARRLLHRRRRGGAQAA